MLAGAIVASGEPVQGQIRVNPTGVNVNGQGATTVFLAFGGLANAYRPVEAFWCGALVSAAPDIGERCTPATLSGRLAGSLSRSAHPPFQSVGSQLCARCSSVTELSESWVAQSFPALLFADDRGREGA